MTDNRDYLERVRKYKARKSQELKYCTRCGRAFPYSGDGPVVCPRCVQKEEEDFALVSRYLETHRSTKKETAKNTGVPEEYLTKWAREGRLVFSSGIEDFRCEICGKPIRTGRICEDCMKKTQKIGFSTNRSNNDGRMRFAGRDN